MMAQAYVESAWERVVRRLFFKSRAHAYEFNDVYRDVHWFLKVHLLFARTAMLAQDRWGRACEDCRVLPAAYRCHGCYGEYCDLCQDEMVCGACDRYCCCPPCASLGCLVCGAPPWMFTDGRTATLHDGHALNSGLQPAACNQRGAPCLL